jgi:hypothetical protein
MENKLELRMYGLVPYNISPIQQGIQFGHAVVEYGQKMKIIGLLNNEHLGGHNQSSNTLYNDWADNWKTFIILNGGTTNNKTSLKDGLPFGSLNNHLLTLMDNNVEFAQFNEPDLGDQLTAVVFIVDERVFNKKDYPEFSDWLMASKYADLIRTELGETVHIPTFWNTIAENIKKSTNKQDQKVYQEWVKLVGGEKNVFLKDFLKNFKLA